MSDAPLAVTRAAFAAFVPGARIAEITPLGSGHIHDTFVAKCAGDDGARRFVLQRINTHVFPDPESLVANLDRVSACVEDALVARGVDPERRRLVAVPTSEGRSLHRDAAGDWWRAFPFIEGSRAHETIDTPARAETAAHAFGAFLFDLSELDPHALRETIPGFHDLAGRLEAFEAAVVADASGRLAKARTEVDTALRHAERLVARADPASLPRRVVHNDCKLNNLLFDAATDEALCVVDLDTVMAGSAVYDFGELVRTGASTAAEDEPDLARVGFDLALFRPLARGFVAGGRGSFTGDEIRAFADAGPRMALENAVRFLADHLDGDRYFRVHRPGHNLDRARVQLRLLESMLEAEAATREIVADLAGETP